MFSGNDVALLSKGTGSTFNLGSSTVVYNGQGMRRPGGGKINSFGYNLLELNGTNGSFSGTIDLK